MPHVLLIDNYDSFTYNLYQAMAMLGAEVTVARNDAISVEHARKLRPTHLVISPGPGTPEQAGISGEMVKAFHAELPVLGVCLGHQTLAAVFGARVGRAQKIVHGKTSAIIHDRRGLYLGLSNSFQATRYHSLLVEEEGLPSVFEISSYTSDGEIMGVRIKGLPVEGVQFHPESILTTEGQRMMLNFIQSKGKA